MSEPKKILHLCADIGSDSKPYQDHPDYEVICIGKDIGVQNYRPPKDVYGIIANPPCPDFSYAKTTGEPRNMWRGMVLVKECLRIIWECQYDLEIPYAKKTPLKFWTLENPSGLLRFFLGKPAFEYSPYEFGDDYKKKTCLWGNFNIPEKSPIECTKPKFDRLKTKEIHGDYYGQLTRQERRSICSPGFAQAFFEVNR